MDPDFRVDVESSIAPIWVNFPKLPVHFFAQNSLFSIARTVGAPLKMDAATKFLTRPSVARICIEMDLLRSFPSRVWIGTGSGGFWQPVEYESVPLYCSKCFRQGHIKEECKMGEGGKTEITTQQHITEPRGGEVRPRRSVDQVYRPVVSNFMLESDMYLEGKSVDVAVPMVDTAKRAIIREDKQKEGLVSESHDKATTSFAPVLVEEAHDRTNNNFTTFQHMLRNLRRRKLITPLMILNL